MYTVSFMTYFIVFCSVVVPFLVAEIWIRLPAKKTEEIPGYKNFPPVYQKFYVFIAWVADVFGGRMLVERPVRSEQLRDLLRLAGINLPPQMVFGAQIFFAGIMAGTTVFVLFLCGIEPGMALMMGSIGIFCGWLYPVMIIDSLAQKRQTAIIRRLPFAIDLISSAMQAGLDFNAAVRYYTTLGFRDPLTTEFSLLLRELEMAKPRSEALLDMANRVQVDAFRSFVAAIIHGSEVGASIVDTMRMQGEDLRRARFNLAERKAARAPSLMIFPIALFILPAVFIMVFVPVILRFKATRG